jgi:2-phosphoglycerate kinase
MPRRRQTDAAGQGCPDGVLWIGGGSGAGKTTVARRLAADLRLRLYQTDEMMADHARRADPSIARYLSEFLDMSMDERWLAQTPRDMLETFHWFRGECFEMVVDDVRTIAARGGVLVEGFRLLPDLVAPLLASSGRAVWLLPSPAFRLAAFERRGVRRTLAERTSDPDRAMRNLLERDRLFTDRLRRQTTALGLSAIEVDVGTTENALVERVRADLGLAAIDS